MPAKPESDLAMAARHVAEARQIVADQQARIDRLRTDGHPTADHEPNLALVRKQPANFRGGRATHPQQVGLIGSPRIRVCSRGLSP